MRLGAELVRVRRSRASVVAPLRASAPERQGCQRERVKPRPAEYRMTNPADGGIFRPGPRTPSRGFDTTGAVRWPN